MTAKQMKKLLAEVLDELRDLDSHLEDFGLSSFGKSRRTLHKTMEKIEGVSK